MSIRFDKESKIFCLEGRDSLYQLQIGPLGHLLHLYYGQAAEGRFDYLYPPQDRGFSPNLYALREERGWSLDSQPQEYSGSLTGDYRLSCLEAETEGGVWGADLCYVNHEIRPGKYALEGLPAALGRSQGWETLCVTLADEATGLRVELLYGLCPELDLITRAARILNGGGEALRLHKAASACLDLPFGDWELLHFPGRHADERRLERTPVIDGIQSFGSRRGTSGHQHNPFLILCESGADEDRGDCLGAMLVYSGGHRMELERDQTGSVRLVARIEPEDFSWLLEPGESFVTPELLLCFSHEGLGELSRRFHRIVKKEICRRKRPYDIAKILLCN